MQALDKQRKAGLKWVDVCALLYIPVYLLWFYWLEHRTITSYWVTDLPVDGWIPFCPEFVLAYVLWYPFLLLPAAYLLVRDRENFRRYGVCLILGLSICMLISTLVPNGQTLRPAQFAQDSVCTRLIGRLYRADTNTNVFPSMHAVGAVTVALAAFRTPSLRRVRVPVLVLGLLILCSTVLIKQHALIDVVAGALLGVLIVLAVYGLPEKQKKAHGPISQKERV